MNKTRERIEYWLDTAKYDLDTAKAMLETKRYLYLGFMCHLIIENVSKLTTDLVKNPNLLILTIFSYLLINPV